MNRNNRPRGRARGDRGRQQRGGHGGHQRGGRGGHQGGGQGQISEEFGDVSRIHRDWRNVPHLIGSIVKQRAAICWAIVIARLIEAAYNLVNVNIAGAFLEISFNHLVMMMKQGDDKVMELGSFKKCFKKIKKEGVAKLSPTTRQNEGLAHKVHWEILSEDNADMDLILDRLNISPVGIVIPVDTELRSVYQGIYSIKRVRPKSVLHALLVVGHGVSPTGRRFLITQNSWDTDWGVEGIGRVTLEDGMTCFMFYPDM